ncbi:helicase-exonuclease AddAB subunit AddA [Domibacillus epiphyticus]|uniref:ATP-dependent helicase/nuclease subunit A n=1 Tax=Domibacillus epiphyticus TaxID=1714355 RepID=A0A1V2A8C4_9BACI|nr:helicase-exonuclease AddAB subunit AddA [Domibacillus epiphyticus]OMP67112.1 helicase-exonuclease AddAB subunit AddA [Domibacillus epiphyticus]
MTELYNIPKKPSDALWTDDQWKAVYAQGSDILVAAAAGSGKTAVLVERIIQKIIRDDAPVDVDELLVVTFTNAAAAEMRHRIGEALEREIERNPSSNRLRRQLRLLNKASISTLHSFCLEVIRKYYYMIDIDPAFRIADDTEAVLIRDEVLEELLEEEYGKENNESFYRLVDTFSGDRSDVELQKAVIRLYDFSRSHPEPEEWLRGISDIYETTDTIDNLLFMNPLKKDIRFQLESALAMLDEGLMMTELPGGPVPRAENFLADAAQVRSVLQCETWEEMYKTFQTVKFPTLKMCKGDEYDEVLKERSKTVRDNAKKIINDLKETFFSRKPENWLRDMDEMKPVVERLAQLVLDFALRYESVKRERGITDFSDLEHYALSILMTDGQPTEAAESYKRRFKEVLVDEYQDVNMVQETIVSLVSANDEQKGNLFMVGDVKQSIYRFRLAEPGLFLGKYKRFRSDGLASGLKISLSRNFRSRSEVLNGTNYLFQQIMGTEVGEIEYGSEEALIPGAAYPDASYPVEVALINSDGPETTAEDEIDREDAEQSQIESRFIASKIKELIESGYPVYDPKTKSERPVQYRDIVILMRSLTWVPEMMEEFKRAGIPVYANTSGGYFQATEISVMLSLLQVVDNPFQDIPLAAVLRSPIVRCTENELALIRIASKKGSYFESLLAFMEDPDSDASLKEKVRPFLEHLEKWRSIGRSGALSDLIWELYLDTQFYAFAGGMPGGKQRQANLRALYDRARQYEETSFRGLFRFLRFIERMRERGDDLGTARALSEQEDVVRIMTIHASKGLEFPVVFTAASGRRFNTMDLNGRVLFDKDYGLAVKYMNPDKRIAWPSLVQLAFQRKKKLELLAEEMRVLYVAMTRAKEKLFITGSVKKAEKKMLDWTLAGEHHSMLLSDSVRASASSYLDWIGPALSRHADLDGSHPLLKDHPSRFHFSVIESAQLLLTEEQKEEQQQDTWLEYIKKRQLYPEESLSKEEIEARMGWQYSYPEAVRLRSKQSVSDLKRINDVYNDGASDETARAYRRPVFRRPRFMQEKQLSPAEIGTAVHTVMQHVPLRHAPEEVEVERLKEELIDKELLTIEQAEAVDSGIVAAFFKSEPGKMLLHADRVHRELPFNMGLTAREAGTADSDEKVLIQGVIDCLFEYKGNLYLLDYKTDGVTDRFAGGFSEAEPVLRKRYDVQIHLYAKAIERIWKQKVHKKFVFFLDGANVMEYE